MNISNFFFKFFNQKKNRGEIDNNVSINRNEYLKVLGSLENTLRIGNHFGQADVVENVISNLEKNEFDTFLKEIKSINFWGGSGAVWEVYFEDENLEKRFNTTMIDLITLIQKTNISNGRINRLKKMFQTNFKN